MMLPFLLNLPGLPQPRVVFDGDDYEVQFTQNDRYATVDVVHKECGTLVVVALGGKGYQVFQWMIAQGQMSEAVAAIQKHLAK